MSDQSIRDYLESAPLPQESKASTLLHTSTLRAYLYGRIDERYGNSSSYVTEDPQPFLDAETEELQHRLNSRENLILELSDLLKRSQATQGELDPDERERMEVAQRRAYVFKHPEVLDPLL